MIKKALILSLAVVMALLVTVNPVSAEENTDDTKTVETQRHSKSKRKRKQETAEPENAIGKDAAKEKALTDAGLSTDQIKRIKARVSSTEDGTVIYKVGFVFEGQKYSYQIDALTGAIISKSSEEFAKKETKASNTKVRPADKQKDKCSDSSISEPVL